ncbi:hypothetical protein D915_001721 [Fasciola hepatica]|uniref:C3H1-type domain-containing protein n=1 Tax=Fasciola hepatica TaxID=6192 RepID=A0A4E0RIY3_FASHE|nr:hypothetical protein D915_001721 [Fasciola hepatica]
MASGAPADGMVLTEQLENYGELNKMDHTQQTSFSKHIGCDSEKQFSGDGISQGIKPEISTMGTEDGIATIHELHEVENHDQSCPNGRRRRRQDWCRWPVCEQYRATGKCASTSVEDSSHPGCMRAHIGPSDSVPVTPEGDVRVCFDSLGLMNLQCTRPECYFYHPPKPIRDQIVARRHAQYLREKVFKTTTDQSQSSKRSHFSSSASHSTNPCSINTQCLVPSGQGPRQTTAPLFRSCPQTTISSYLNDPINSLLYAYLSDPTLNTALYPNMSGSLFASKSPLFVPTGQQMDFCSFKHCNINSLTSPSPAAVALMTGNPTRMDSNAQVTSTRSDAGIEPNWIQLLNRLHGIPVNEIRPPSAISSFFDPGLNTSVPYKAPFSFQPCTLPMDNSLWASSSHLIPGMNYINQLNQQLITGSHLPVTGAFTAPLSSTLPVSSATPNLSLNRLLPSNPTNQQLAFGQATPFPFLPLPITLPFPLTGILDSQAANPDPNFQMSNN